MDYGLVNDDKVIICPQCKSSNISWITYLYSIGKCKECGTVMFGG